MTDEATEVIDYELNESYFMCSVCSERICCGAYRGNTERRAAAGMDPAIVDRGFVTSHGQRVCTPCRNNGCLPAVELAPIDIEVPAEYRDATTDQLERSLDLGLRKWPKQTPLIILIGLNGSGKTHALWALQRLIAFKGHKVTYHDTRSLRTKWASSFPEKRAEIEQRLVKAPLLILDDFTAGEATNGWVERMEYVIDQRTQNRRPLIIAAHSTLKAIGEMFQKAVASRLKYFTVLQTTCGDRRGKA